MLSLGLGVSLAVGLGAGLDDGAVEGEPVDDGCAPGRHPPTRVAQRCEDTGVSPRPETAVDRRPGPNSPGTDHQWLRVRSCQIALSNCSRKPPRVRAGPSETRPLPAQSPTAQLIGQPL